MADSDPRIVIYTWLATILALEPEYYETEKAVYEFSNGRTFDEKTRNPYEDFGS